MTINQQIVAEARIWLGTAFAHQGRCKASAHSPGGCDCLGLIMGVAETLGLRSRAGSLLSGHDITCYPSQQNTPQLYTSLCQLLSEENLDAMAPGDLLLFNIGKYPQHLGIISDYQGGELGIIHTHQSAQAVVEHRLCEHWRRRIYARFVF